MVSHIQIGVGTQCINILLRTDIGSPLSIVSQNKLIHTKVTDHILESSCAGTIVCADQGITVGSVSRQDFGYFYKFIP